MELESNGNARTPHPYAQNGTLDFRGQPALKKKTGKWAGAFPMLVIQVTSTIVSFGIISNVVTYMTTVLHQGVSRSAKDLNNWQGILFTSCVLGAFLSDTYWGRYRTMLYAFLLYCVGLSCLTISSSLKSMRPPSCPAQNYDCKQANSAQSAFFYFSLYAVAFANGGMAPSFTAFGADQFDEADDRERPHKYTFFNYILCSVHLGGVISVTLLVYLQDHVGFGWGFGSLIIVLAASMVLFLIQTKRYRYRNHEGSPLTKIAQVVVAAFRNRNSVSSSEELYEEKLISSGKRRIPHTDEFAFLDKAAVNTGKSEDTQANPWKLSTVTRVEEVKMVIRMLPVWFATLWFSTAPSQSGTFFLRQGMAMDNHLGSFKVPPASMLVFSNLAVLFSLLVYDKLLVPAIRKVTKIERGITLLQRIGIGIFISVIALVVAALMEMKRKQHDSKISIFWLVPQYVIIGVADGMANTPLLEFFHEQSPDTFHSLGVSLGFGNIGVGSFLSSALITCVNKAAPTWLQNDVNKGHYDYYYWLLAGLSLVNLVFYIPLAWWYSYKAPDEYVETKV